MNDINITIPIEDSLMKEKRYSPKLYGIISFVTGYSGIIEGRECRSEILSCYGTGTSKFKKDFDFLVNSGYINVVDNFYQLQKYFSNGVTFVSIERDKIEDLFAALDDFEFKVYVFLLRKYDLYLKYRNRVPHKFSKSSLLSALGYSVNSINIKKMQGVLDKLENLGLIEYDHNRCSSLGAHGTYWKLLKVNVDIKK